MRDLFSARALARAAGRDGLGLLERLAWRGRLPGADGDVDGARQALAAGRADGEIYAAQAEGVGAQQVERVLAGGDALERQLYRGVGVAAGRLHRDVLAGEPLDREIGDGAADDL